MDQLQGLRVFCRVVERGSFSAVAKEFAISQPSASRHVVALEERLGVRLLVRTTRRVTPTEAGRAFYERALPAIRELLDAESEVTAGTASLSGPLRVSAPSAFGRRFVLPTISGFLAVHAAIRCELLLSDRPIDLVGEAVDLAIRIGAPGSGSLTQRKIAMLSLALVASPDYLRRASARKPLDDGEPRDAVFHADTRQQVASLVAQGVLDAVPDFRVRMVCDDIEAVRLAALDGLGIAPLPVWLIADDVASGALVSLSATLPLPDVPVFAVFPAGRAHSARLAAFLRALESDLTVRLARVQAGFEGATTSPSFGRSA